MYSALGRRNIGDLECERATKYRQKCGFFLLTNRISDITFWNSCDTLARTQNILTKKYAQNIFLCKSSPICWNLHWQNLHVAPQESIAAPGKLNLQDYQHVTSALSRIQVCLRFISFWLLVYMLGFVLPGPDFFTKDDILRGFLFHSSHFLTRRWNRGRHHLLRMRNRRRVVMLYRGENNGDNDNYEYDDHLQMKMKI